MAADIHCSHQESKIKLLNNSFRGFVFYKKNAILATSSNGGIMSNKDNSISFAMGILGGVLGGIAAGILFAPKSGKETRENIKECVKEFAEKHAPHIDKAKKQAMESIDLVKYKIERQCNRLSDSIRAKNLQKAKEKEYSSDELN